MGLIGQFASGDIVGGLFTATVLVIALSIHEYGHALAATLQGDPTAKLAGRLTLNPLSHIDPFGALAMLLVGFGWGKPVPFAPNMLRNKRFGPALVALAGPTTNVALAILAAAGLGIMGVDRSPGLLARFLFVALYINVILAVFNLLPIPPLDGSRILSAALPPEKQRYVYWLDRWGFVLLLVVVFLLFDSLLRPVINLLTTLLLRIFGA